MEFKEKLQELRKQKGLTQEELAERLYVSRTAVSKWESGRGYPNIESLKAIAKFFSVTVDQLLSTDEILTVAEEDSKEKDNHRKDLILGLLDIGAAMLIFLPLFAEPVGEMIVSVSLIQLNAVQPYLKVIYLSLVILTSLSGVLTLSMQNCNTRFWVKSKTKISLTLSVLLVLIFILSSQPYAASLAFILLIIKALALIKQGRHE